MGVVCRILHSHGHGFFFCPEEEIVERRNRSLICTMRFLLSGFSFQQSKSEGGVDRFHT